MSEETQLYEVHFWDERSDVRKLKGVSLHDAKEYAIKVIESNWLNIKIRYYKGKIISPPFLEESGKEKTKSELKNE